MLFGISTNDLPTITGAVLLLLLVALLAGFLPARRASAIDPVVLYERNEDCRTQRFDDLKALDERGQPLIHVEAILRE